MITTKRERLKKKVIQLRKKPRGTVTRRDKLTSAANIKVMERRHKAMSLRKDGWEYNDIADVLGCNAATVKEDVRYCLNITATEMMETADEERELQKLRLNAMLVPNLRFATQPHTEVRHDRMTGAEILVEMPPDPAYANVVLKIEERRSKLLALDKPEVKKVEVSGMRLYPGVNTDEV